MFATCWYISPEPCCYDRLNYPKRCYDSQGFIIKLRSHLHIYSIEGDYSGFSACNAIRAVHGGGEPGSGGRTNRIEYVTMTTGGDGQDFGDLSFAESFLTATSDSHGGLGGF